LDELGFQHLILCVLGVSGLLEFYGTRRARDFWSPRRCLAVGICSAPTYLAGALVAFPSLSGASSLQLFGFIGCALGLLGAVRLMADASDSMVPAGRSRKA
jgi:hypothetical protein